MNATNAFIEESIQSNGTNLFFATKVLKNIALLMTIKVIIMIS